MGNFQELNKIKKIYGERFMKMCRELFPTLLEQEGALLEVLARTFANNSKVLYEDIIEKGLQEQFKQYIYSNIAIEYKNEKIVEDRTPYELLDKAGYKLYECNTEEEIQEFKKYYAQGEELCTFNGNRLDRCVVFFAVKKDLGNIKREDFTNPQREDEYGTSVMGIQFEKEGMCTVSIKNRYNHTVNNPDATYGNDLDRIIPGLTKSFENLLLERGLELNSSNVESFEIPGYVVAGNGKYYKYNYEINGNYYCPGNIIIANGGIIKLPNPEKQQLIDYFILDTENKTLQLYDENIKDSFIDEFKNIQKIEIIRDKQSKEGSRTILIKKEDLEEPIKIKIDSNNQIIGYENKYLIEVGDNFLRHNPKLEELNLPKLERVGNFFLQRDKALENLDLPNLILAGNNFMDLTIKIKELTMPKLEQVGNNFLEHNRELTILNFPNLRLVGKYFICFNDKIESVNMPILEKVGRAFLYTSKMLKKLELPNLIEVEDSFICLNKILEEVYMPKLVKVGNGFLARNENLRNINFPNLIEMGHEFMVSNEILEEVRMLKLEKVGRNFLHKNKKLKKLELPNLIEVDGGFMWSNKILEEVYMPKLVKVGSGFLAKNENLRNINFPNLIGVWNEFMANNEILEEAYMPKLKKVGDDFLFRNEKLRNVNFSNLVQIGRDFLPKNLFIDKENIISANNVKAGHKKTLDDDSFER